MLKKLRLLLLRRRLKSALEREEQLRFDLQLAKEYLIPALEREIEELELTLALDAYHRNQEQGQ